MGQGLGDPSALILSLAAKWTYRLIIFHFLRESVGSPILPILFISSMAEVLFCISVSLRLIAEFWMEGFP